MSEENHLGADAAAVAGAGSIATPKLSHAARKPPVIPLLVVIVFSAALLIMATSTPKADPPKAAELPEVKCPNPGILGYEAPQTPECEPRSSKIGDGQITWSASIGGQMRCYVVGSLENGGQLGLNIDFRFCRELGLVKGLK